MGKGRDKESAKLIMTTRTTIVILILLTTLVAANDNVLGNYPLTARVISYTAQGTISRIPWRLSGEKAPLVRLQIEDKTYTGEWSCLKGIQVEAFVHARFSLRKDKTYPDEISVLTDDGKSCHAKPKER